MALFENYSDIFTKINRRYVTNPISGISGPTNTIGPSSETLGGVTGQIFVGAGVITVSNSGAYAAVLVQKGFDGTDGSIIFTAGSGKDFGTYDFYPGFGGGTGAMVVAYGWLPAGNYSYIVDSTTSFNGLVASNTSSLSTTIDKGFGIAVSYSTINGGLSGIAGSSSLISTFPPPLNAIRLIGGSGAGGTLDGVVGGGAGGYYGAGGLLTSSSNLNGGSAAGLIYGAGGGGGSVLTSLSKGAGGSGGPGCVMLFPIEILASKISDFTTVIASSNFNMGGYSLTNLLDERLISCLNSNALVTYNVTSFNAAGFSTLYPFGSSDTITYLNGVGFKTMPFALTGNSIKYAIVRNPSTNLYYMTLFAENTCTLTLNKALTSVNYICCGNGGNGDSSTVDYAGSGGGGGQVVIGTIASIASGITISITRANGNVNTVLAVGGTTTATAGTTYNSSGTPGSSITLNSGYSLANVGFGGSGSSGSTIGFFPPGGSGGAYGVNAASPGRYGLGYGAGAGGEGRAAIFPSTVAGNPGVVILSFLI
jgi:hypothetical protein